MAHSATMQPSGGKMTRVVRWISLAIAAGAFLAALGPFGSYTEAGSAALACYWIGSMLLGLLLYGAAYKVVSAWVRPNSLGWWPAFTGATLLASVPEALATRAAAFWLLPGLAHHRLPLPLWFAQTATIAVLCMGAVSFVLRRSAPASSRGQASLPPSYAAKASFGKDVLALQMEDHYVRVHRSAGSELILMPLARAIDSIEAEGLRTHRSWWVARHAVAAVEGDARSMRVVLSNGLVAPVARSSVTHLRAAGWMSDAASQAPSKPL